MLLIPNAVFIQYEGILKKRRIAMSRFTEYKKWLRYYLDFCDKYPVPDSRSERVRLFTEKLREKKQSEEQRQRAAFAVSLYFEMQKQEYLTAGSRDESSPPCSGEEPISYEANLHPSRPIVRSAYYTEAGYAVKSDSPEWDDVLKKGQDRAAP